MQDVRIQKIALLIDQKKFREAEGFAREVLSENPQNAWILAFLAEIKLQQERYDAAFDLIHQAIGLNPEEGYFFYIKSRLGLATDDILMAEGCAEQAIALDPEDADFRVLLSRVYGIRKKFEAALEAAESALELESDNTSALNARSSALIKLGRAAESGETVNESLRQDPNNSYTHSNAGWIWLERGDHNKARGHFKEALLFDPTNQMAQEGMKEALKAKNPVYKLYLAYQFWVGRLSENYQWWVVIGFYVGSKLIRLIAHKNENLGAILYPVLYVLVFVALSTWILDPIGNFLLRLDRFGRYLLSEKQKWGANLVGVCLLLVIAGLGLYFLTSIAGFLTLAGYGFGMMVPIGFWFSDQKRPISLMYYGLGMALVGAVAVVMAFATGEPIGLPGVVFMLGFFLFQWVANYATIKANNPR